MEKDFLDEGLTDKDLEDMEEARKELVDVVVTNNKTHFTNI